MAKFRALLTIFGREANDGSMLGVIPVPVTSMGNDPPSPMVYLLREGDKVTARLVLERVGQPPKVVLPR
ncbi:MAG: hypothetical protein K2Y37_12850 [Pirellulales bacterium]|nr:hypothetical protein [Pirellulales bacterium]